jgi:hypothetical protein
MNIIHHYTYTTCSGHLPRGWAETYCGINIIMYDILLLNIVLRWSYTVLNKGIDYFTLKTPTIVLGKDIPIISRVLVILRDDEFQCPRFSSDSCRNPALGWLAQGQGRAAIFCECGNEPTELHKFRVIWLAEDVLTSQEGLCFMEIVT